MAFKKQPWKIHNLSTFRLGMNTQQTPDEIQDEELADCENFSVEEDSLSTSPGYSSWDDDLASHPGPYWGGFFFKRSDGNNIDIRQRQGKLEYIDPNSDKTWLPCVLPTTGSPAAEITLTEKPCTFAALNDICIWTNGYDTVMSSTDGITWTLQPSIPISRVVFNNGKNRVLYLAQKDSPYRFDWSNINAPLTIDASSYQLVDPNSNGMVLGAGKTPEGTTLIFKESALYSVSDFVDDGVIDINYIGHTLLTSHRTICTTNNSVIWCSWAGVEEYIGGTIRNIFGRIAISTSKGEVGSRNAGLTGELYCAAYYNNKYHLSMPDHNISDDYNGQEYIIYKNLVRNDPIQPYVISRNKRFFGCYWIEDAEFEYGRDITLYVGDSRPESELAITGSPAVQESPIFAWVNDFREVSAVGFPIEQGLMGEAQPAYFVTKYFTQKVPFFVKKFKKLFLNCKFTDSADIQIGYRSDPFSVFTMVTIPVETTDIDWEYDDGTTGGFTEGFGFSQESIANLFQDIENTEKPRGIQFKVEVNEIYDVTNFGLAYKYQVKEKFL